MALAVVMAMALASCNGSGNGSSNGNGLAMAVAMAAMGYPRGDLESRGGPPPRVREALEAAARLRLLLYARSKDIILGQPLVISSWSWSLPHGAGARPGKTCVCLFVCLFVRLFVCLFVRVFACVFVRLVIWSFVCMSVCLSV